MVTKFTKPYTIYGGVSGRPTKAKYTIDDREELEKIFAED